MCGRYVSKEIAAWEREFAYRGHGMPTRFESYNIAPTQMAPVITETDGERRLELMRWGLIPSWVKDTKIGNQCINARAETVATKPAFRAAMKGRRCIVPATGYYEWQATSLDKQPYFITSLDERPFGMAGLWEAWVDKETGESIRSYAILTCAVNNFLAHIHDRMPVILGRNSYDTWLTGSLEQALPLTCTSARDLHAYPVSKAVNSPSNNGPALIEQAA